MKAFRMLCSILVIFTTALCVTTAAQNLILRTSDVYLFYFNDSGAVTKRGAKQTFDYLHMCTRRHRGFYEQLASEGVSGI